jgi:hypothetical protein
VGEGFFGFKIRIVLTGFGVSWGFLVVWISYLMLASDFLFQNLIVGIFLGAKFEFWNIFECEIRIFS